MTEKRATAKTMEPEIAHATFSVERSYPQSPAKVFKAFSDPATKRRWFAEGEGWTVFAYELDFRVGGAETSRFAFKEGPEIRNDTIFQDIVPEQRIVFTYKMAAGEKPLSVSLSTIELTPAGKGTHMTYTEQGVYLDGQDSVKGREEGSRWLLEQLAKELEQNG
jgi:uncharacterized protein YndB with AHSA1/START domain